MATSVGVPSLYCPAVQSPADTMIEREWLAETVISVPGDESMTMFTVTSYTTPRSLKHLMSGLRELKQFRWVELVNANGQRVKGWSHDHVVLHLKQHIRQRELKLEAVGVNMCGQRHDLEITVDILYEDGPESLAIASISEIAVRMVVNVIVRIVDKATSKPEVTNVQYKDCVDLRLRHGALTSHFMQIGADGSVSMVQGQPRAFKCYRYIGRDDKGPSVCNYIVMMQDPDTQRFLEVNGPSYSLVSTVDSRPVIRDMKDITDRDGRFFVIYPCGQVFYIRPLMMTKHYMCYNHVDGLRLVNCDKPPYTHPSDTRNFSFELF